MSFLSKIKNKFNKKSNSSTVAEEEFELDISWDDISMATQDNKSNNCISRAMKRMGLYGRTTECLLILDDGSEYYPQQLSCHWEAYNSSPKFKPKLITYKRLK
jgi:hypothetical protein